MTKPILWLRDMLPGVVPDARIFTFGYFSGTFKTNDVDEFMTDPSRYLLGVLRFKRRALKEVDHSCSRSNMANLYKAARAHYLYSS